MTKNNQGNAGRTNLPPQEASKLDELQNDYTKVEQANDKLHLKETYAENREKVLEDSRNKRYVLGDQVAREVIERIAV